MSWFVFQRTLLKQLVEQLNVVEFCTVELFRDINATYVVFSLNVDMNWINHVSVRQIPCLN